MSPPSHYRAIRLIIRLAARRFWNRANSQLSSGLGRKKKAGGRRRGTPGKSRGGSILLGIFVLIMLPQCIGFSARLVAKLIAVAEEAEEKPAQRKTTDSFRDAIQRSLAEHRELETGGAEGAEQGTVPRDPDARELQERVHTEIDRLGEALEKLQDQQEKGRRERSPHLMWPSEGQWPSGEPRRRLFIALALFFTLLFPAVLFTTLGSANRDLSQVEWSLEWLFTFPVPGESLFLAKILEYSFVNAVGWFFFCCPLVAIFWMAGLGWTSIPLAVGSMYFLNALVAALRITAETALRKHLSLSRIKNLQA
ncbi:MAG: hypothetical protein JXA90_06050, partial [Planctomycetes bacterium]|nr:hypothetical protein [Planctomycetota bacterium]